MIATRQRRTLSDHDALAALIERIHTACLTVECMPPDGPDGYFSTWPRYKLTWWDAEEHGSHRTDAAVTAGLIRAPQFAPTPRQVSDCLPALTLLDGVPSRWRRVVSARAHQDWYGWPGGWRAIGADCSCSHKTARLWYICAINHAYRNHTGKRRNALIRQPQAAC